MALILSGKALGAEWEAEYSILVVVQHLSESQVIHTGIIPCQVGQLSVSSFVIFEAHAHSKMLKQTKRRHKKW